MQLTKLFTVLHLLIIRRTCLEWTRFLLLSEWKDKRGQHVSSGYDVYLVDPQCSNIFKEPSLVELYFQRYIYVYIYICIYARESEHGCVWVSKEARECINEQSTASNHLRNKLVLIYSVKSGWTFPYWECLWNNLRGGSAV